MAIDTPGRAMRLVISGITEQGRSAVLSDDPIRDLTAIPGMPTVSVRDLWVTETAPVDLKDLPDRPKPDSIGAPRGGGHIVRLLDIEPDPPGYDIMSGWHATPTIDHVIVLAGEIWCVFEDGETLLSPGDILVQGGVAHAWSNRGQETCRMIGILVDAVA
jgi:mannose-6-phosphate isomerase-like protein (cupin superfamily)